MATTSLWHIEGRLKDLISYVENPEKTRAENPGLQPLWDVFSYVSRPEATEQGLIGTIVVKDHSRLGRNRLVVGQLLEEDFVRLDIRYIAIMDNIDTAKGISDLVPMQDLFNEWHAKNTSDKVRKVMQSKGMSGKPLTTNPPFGYMKSSRQQRRMDCGRACRKDCQENL